MTSTQAKQRLKAEIKAYGKSKRLWYRDVYLLSEHWKTLRILKFAEVGRKCQDCGSTNTFSIQCHHVKYRSIFDVTVADLRVLCVKCHDKEHERLKRNRRKNRNPRKPRNSKKI